MNRQEMIASLAASVAVPGINFNVAPKPAPTAAQDSRDCVEAVFVVVAEERGKLFTYADGSVPTILAVFGTREDAVRFAWAARKSYRVAGYPRYPWRLRVEASLARMSLTGERFTMHMGITAEGERKVMAGAAA